MWSVGRFMSEYGVSRGFLDYVYWGFFGMGFRGF